MQTDEFHFKKKYGQNFLKDDTIPRKIVDCSKIEENSLVIEIGPGAGALTKKLAACAKSVLAYEIDTNLEDILSRELCEFNNIKIIFDDFLNRDVLNDIKDYQFDHFYIIANLPYYITTPIITKIIDSNIDPEKVVVMVQKEVGERFSASCGTKDYGSITVFLNYYFNIRKEFLVSRNCFIPKPNVDSVIISFNKKDRLELKDRELFFKLVRDSFQFKRKNLKNNLRKYDLEKLEIILKKHGLDLTVRAEELPLEIFVDISNSL